MLPTLVYFTAVFAALASAADITFTSGADCTGTGLFGTRNKTTLPCSDLPELADGTKATSVILSNLENGQIVTFFSDSTCSDQITAFTQDTCYTPGSTPWGGFTITNSSSANSTDVVPYGVKLSNYQGLSQSSPYDIDIAYNRAFFGFSSLRLATALSFSAFVVGCSALVKTGPDPVAIYVCVAVGVATVLTFVGERLLNSASAPIREAIQMATGTISDRRSIGAESWNEMYMDALMNVTTPTDMQVRKVGYLKRDMGRHGVHLSPAYELEGGENTGKWHISAHYDQDTNSVIHHLQHGSEWDSADEQQDTQKRTPYTYNSIRWAKNGIDFNVCIYDKPEAGYNVKTEALYQNFYNELQCYSKPGLEKDKFLLVDLYDEQDDIVAEVHLAGYDGKPGKSAIGSFAPCQKQTAEVNQDCIAGN